MPVRVEEQDAPAFLAFVLTGSWPAVQEQVEIRRQLKEHGKLSRQSVVLVDIRDVTELPSYDDVDGAMQAAAREIMALPRRAALVVQPGATFGVGRMLQSLAPSGMELQLFEDPEVARDWLMLA